MFYIAHRGNLVGNNFEKENSPDYIDVAINKGFNVELDLWVQDQRLLLGHDIPTYEISVDWIFSRSDYLWIHCKNSFALHYCVDKDNLNYFFHDIDDYTITSKGYIWTYPGKVATKNGICVLPEWNVDIKQVKLDSNFVGVCSDFVELIFTK